MRIQNYELVPVRKLIDHPENRKVRMEGEDWEGFVASIRRDGVLVPLVVRPAADGSYQIVCGHRRKAAAIEAGVSEVLCRVFNFSDEEALRHMILDNLQRAELDVLEEAEGVRALVRGAGMSEQEVAKALHRSEGWVRLRQGLLKLGAEIQIAAKERRVSLGVVEEVLRVEERDRPRAEQMVLHPQWQEEALNTRQAVQILRDKITEPRAREREWNAGRDELLATVKEELTVGGPEGLEEHGLEPLKVRLMDYGEEPGREYVGAFNVIDESKRLPGGPIFIRVVELARRHGLEVEVYPPKDSDSAPEVVCSWVLIEDAEAGRREYDQDPWLKDPKDRVREKPDSEKSVEVEKEEFVEAELEEREEEKDALALLDEWKDEDEDNETQIGVSSEGGYRVWRVELKNLFANFSVVALGACRPSILESENKPTGYIWVGKEEGQKLSLEKTILAAFQEVRLVQAEIEEAAED